MDCLLPVLALAASAAGTGMQVAGQNKAQNQMNQKTQDELNRQAAIQQKSANNFAVSLAQSAPDVAQKQLDEGDTERQATYNQLQSVPLAAGSQAIEGGTSPVLNLRDAAQTQLSNKGRGKLGAYDKWTLDQAVKNLRAGQMQGILNQQSAQSQNVLPLELQQASHAGDALSGAGMGVGLLGSLLSMGSMAGLGAGTAASGAANTANLGSTASRGALLGGQVANGLYGMRSQPQMGYGYR